MTANRKPIEVRDKESQDFWSARRWSYNMGLILSGLGAFMLYGVFGSTLIKDFEVTGFTIFFGAIGYGIMMGIANVLYGLGNLVDVTFNPEGKESFRIQLYHAGFWFSVALPFLIPFLALYFHV